MHEEIINENDSIIHKTKHIFWGDNEIDRHELERNYNVIVYYDKHENVTLKQTFDENGVLSLKEEYEYKYDEYNNSTHTIYSENDSVKKVFHIDLKYY